MPQNGSSTIRETISLNLGIPQELVNHAISRAHREIVQFTIQKNRGGVREISQPSGKLKTIQYWLIQKVLNELPVHTAAMAYRKGKSILDNAKCHRSNQFFLKIDLEDFFPSIKFEDLRPLLETWASENRPAWEMNEEAYSFIRSACFDILEALPIGYPSSPCISNAVMHAFDILISDLIEDEKTYGQVTYTRYADDLIFSTDKVGACKSLLTDVSNVIQKHSSPNIRINKSKTKLGSSSGGSAIVTGLRICADENITIHRSHKDHIRLLLSLYKKNELNRDEYGSLNGHLSYVRHVAPRFNTKLQNKFHQEIAELWRTLYSSDSVN